MSSHDKDKYFPAFTVSLLVHLVFFLMLQEYSNPIQNDSTEVEVVYLSPQQFVSHTDLADDVAKKVEKLKKKSRYYSKLTRQVKEQMVAKKSGPTRNAQNRPAPKAFGLNAIEYKKDLKKKGPGEKRPLEAPVPSIARTKMLFPSTVSEFIPNVKTGSITALNTHQFTYYSFFSRTSEQIRPRWVQELRHFSQTTPPSQFNRAAQKPRVTQIEILIDRHGLYVDHRVKRSSGVKRLDIAAVEAIIEAAPLINPPKALLEEDGFIHLDYNFIVDFEPRYLAEDSI